MRKQSGFFKVPHELFLNEEYKNLSLHAKILYSLMLDRLSLSEKNNWIDENGRVYIFFTLKEAMQLLGIGKDKCIKVFAELDAKQGYGLIEKKAQGLGKPMIIYVLKTEPKKSASPTTESIKNRALKVGFTDSNNTYINNTDFNNTHLNQSYNGKDEILKRNKWILKLKNNIDYHILKEKYDEKRLLMIVEIMADCFLTDSGYIIISGIKKPSSVVRERLLLLDFSHIEYVLDSLLESSKDIKNIKSYILSCLYNSYDTMELYYERKVKADLRDGV